jgi:hypothetical protein
MEVSSQLHASATLSPGKRAHNTLWIGGCVSPKAGLDATEKRKILPLLGIEPQPSSP